MTVNSQSLKELLVKHQKPVLNLQKSFCAGKDHQTDVMLNNYKTRNMGAELSNVLAAIQRGSIVTKTG